MNTTDPPAPATSGPTTANPAASATVADVPGPAPKAKKTEREHKAGTLKQLSDAMRDCIRSLAATSLYGTVYDNINFQDRIAEQTVGRSLSTNLSLL